jgi:NAD(P)-dependent dehydrogenase (short-subunit alcohol dehydrogenase family)
MEARLEDRVTLITGGAGQLGRHVVERTLTEGARVHVPVFHPEQEAGLREHLGSRADEATLHLEADLTDPDRVEALFRNIEASEGRPVQVLFNLAGGFAMAPLGETDPGTWNDMWNANATTAFLCCREAFAGMRQEGWGRIVNVSAAAALDRGRPGLAAYGAAKAAVLNLTHTLSREGLAHGITVNAVLPSIIDTPQNRRAMPDADTATWLPPESIAGVLTYLASEEAGIVNGAAVTLALG